MPISGNTCLTRGGAVWLTSASGGSADRNVLVLVEGVGVTFLRVEDVGIASVIPPVASALHCPSTCLYRLAALAIFVLLVK